MKGMTEFMREHEARLKGKVFGEGFWNFHLLQIRFLQHERLVHLLVMLFTMFAFLFFFTLFLFFKSMLFLALFVLCLLMSIFYVVHYFRLENTVTRWYFIYNDHAGDNRGEEA